MHEVCAACGIKAKEAQEGQDKFLNDDRVRKEMKGYFCFRNEKPAEE